MKTIQFRKSPISSVICAGVFLLLWVGGLLGSVSVFIDPAQGGINPPRNMGIIVAGFYLVYTLAFLLPILRFGIKRIRNCQIRYVLTEVEMRCYRGNKLTQQIPRSRISAFGCYAVNRNAVLFFTTATEAEISILAQQNWDGRILLYSQEQLEVLEQTTEGIRQIKIALYIQHGADTCQNSVLTMEYSTKQMKEIGVFWDMKPVHIGEYAYAQRELIF